MASAMQWAVRHYGTEVMRHHHAYHQVVLPYVGQLDIETNGQAGFVAGSVGSFVAAGSDHSFHGRSDSACIVLDIPHISAEDAANTEDMPTFFAIGPDIQGLIDYMKYSRSDDFTLRLRTAWSELLLARLAEQRIVLPGRERLAVSRAVAFMRERLAQSIGVRDIARAAGTSSSRLHEAFVRQLGTTPHAYLVALRLDAAERMLADPSLSIAEVAIRSGHFDQSALGRALRRERDTTPAMLRRVLRGGTGGNAQTPKERS
ncbi:AraC family transcriptional regulator [Methylobacterium radiotolerans]|nr:AraC family transcriptional regulator [Methylobacterium radiotolerans]